MFGFEKKI